MTLSSGRVVWCWSITLSSGQCGVVLVQDAVIWQCGGRCPHPPTPGGLEVGDSESMQISFVSCLGYVTTVTV